MIKESIIENILPSEGTLRTTAEHEAAQAYVDIFDQSSESLKEKLHTFPKFIRRQEVTRFLSLYELFKKIVTVKGSIVECGVFRGFGLMSWAQFSAVLEPANLMRRIYGFDSFEGFPSVSDKDTNHFRKADVGDLSFDSYEQLQKLISAYDDNRFLGHVDKVKLVKGDVCESIPTFIQENPHLTVSLLFLDFDLYEPTKVAIEHFLPRMPKGSIIAFDELDNPIWPGETLALIETLGFNRLKLQRQPWDPYISYAVVE